ncbi:peptide/nickel transport system substrate-binding protein [Hymenobacter daecheongensis DSM 21074]|uniref:Peptide/nickel transport system substrate-binding protein n=1 Tax=Hymenobacter daecheongensis DSM 21074 TaxID=1121955 RepID=A0A1M6CX03_9BACT|nr:ABC transporter substrate-binding protein [Hymenobacter daecheongensis]SHI65344.1 peptide/nickel transport system substrate-binding protein [Hymenobacter daecheongensis DSM 21074]
MKRYLLGLGCLLGLSVCSSPTPNHADTVRIRWARDPENLDPLVLPNAQAVETTNLLHCSLLTVDYAQKKFVPWLAETMPTVRRTDSLTLVTYRLRPEAAWDNGQPILASDVAFTLKVMSCPGLPNEAARAQFAFIESIQLDSLDRRRFTLAFRGKSPDLVQASGDYPILAEHQLDPRGQLRHISLAALRADTVQATPRRSASVTAFARGYAQKNLGRHPENLPGSGPYVLKEWRAGRHVLLQRKKQWWGDRVPAAPPQLRAHPKTLDYQIITDDATALLALRRGDIDVYPMMPAKEFVRLRQNQKAGDLAFYTADSYEMLAAGFNMRQPALRDALTRQAFSHLFDIPGLIQASQQGLAYPSVSLVSPTAGPLYNDSLPLLTFDPQKAQALLTQAGWTRNSQGWTRHPAGAAPQRLEPTFSYRAGEPAYEAVALQFRAAAAKIGIQVQPRPMEASLFSQQLRAGRLEIYLQSLSGNPFVYNFAPILHSQSTGWGNFTGFGTATTDQLIEAIAAEEDPARQAQLLRKFQRVLRQDCPLVVLYFLRYRLAAARRLTNLHVTGIRPGYEAAAIKSQPAGAVRP